MYCRLVFNFRPDSIISRTRRTYSELQSSANDPISTCSHTGVSSWCRDGAHCPATATNEAQPRHRQRCGSISVRRTRHQSQLHLELATILHELWDTRTMTFSQRHVGRHVRALIIYIKPLHYTNYCNAKMVIYVFLIATLLCRKSVIWLKYYVHIDCV